MVCSKLSASSCFPVVPEDVFHPDSSFCFPKRVLGKTNPKMRACQAEYFKTWPWLTNDIEKDVVFCHLCVVAESEKKWLPREPTHRSHRKDSHTGRMQWSFSKSTRPCTVTKKWSRCQLFYLVLAQTLGKCFHPSIRRKRKLTVSSEDSCQFQIFSKTRLGAAWRQWYRFKLLQLLKLSARNDPALAEWLKKKTNKYVSHSVQNELLQNMALTVLREISHSIHECTFYSIMCDECTDAFNKKQLVICIRWIAKDLKVHEEM